MDKNVKIALIVVIALVAALIVLFVLPAMIMVQMSDVSAKTTDDASQAVSAAMCRAMTCSVDADCVARCGPNGKCVGVSEIGGSVIPGHCDL
jgi:hypothetical protein